MNEQLETICLQRIEALPKVPERPDYHTNLLTRLKKELVFLQNSTLVPLLLFMNGLAEELKRKQIGFLTGSYCESYSLVAHGLGLAALEPVRHRFLFEPGLPAFEAGRVSFCFYCWEEDLGRVVPIMRDLLPGGKRKLCDQLLDASIARYNPKNVRARGTIKHIQNALHERQLLDVLTFQGIVIPGDLIQSPSRDDLIPTLFRSSRREVQPFRDVNVRRVLRRNPFLSPEAWLTLLVIDDPIRRLIGTTEFYLHNRDLNDLSLYRIESGKTLSVVTEILREAKGIPIFIDQVYELLNQTTGLEGHLVYEIVKAFVRKEGLEQARESFMAAAVKNGFEDHALEKLFHRLAAFSEWTVYKAAFACRLDGLLQRIYAKTFYPGPYGRAVQILPRAGEKRPVSIDMSALRGLFRGEIA